MSTPIDGVEERTQSKKPSDSAFRQQKLPAWQPILTAGTVLPMFFVIGILFVPIGIGLLITSNNVMEKIVDYTECISSKSPGKTCSDVTQYQDGTPCSCKLNFTLEEAFTAPVYMYYGLTNFYQNHRRYVKSRDDNQLLGEKVTGDDISSDCEPYDKNDANDTSLPYAPCGAIANSLFNDSFTLFYENGDENQTVAVNNMGIAWPTDKSTKFDNPSPKDNLTAAFAGTLKPKFWQKPVYKLDPQNPGNNGYKNEDLIVWMRTAALPNFRKLYRRISHEGIFTEGLPPGTYHVAVAYNYPVAQFSGTKSFILSTSSWLGGKNPFLGIAYIVVGCICFVLGIAFLIIHIKYGKSQQEIIHITRTS